jgi:hypothetical protein
MNLFKLIAVVEQQAPGEKVFRKMMRDARELMLKKTPWV